MSNLARESYLSFCCLALTAAVAAPLFGVALPTFIYRGAGGTPVELPDSVALYAVLLVVSLATLARRFVTPKGTGNAG